MSDLASIIEDAVTDAELPEPVETLADSVEVAPAAPEPVVEPVKEPAQTVVEPPSPAEEFDQKFGLAATSASGRENRIPYSRVKKITEKAVAEAVAAKSKEYETSHTPATRYQELETKFKDYEDRVVTYEKRLEEIGRFENIMMNDVPQFITMLSRLPQYATVLAPLFEAGGQPATQQRQPVSDDMPQPDQKFSDGSLGYSMDGLKALNEWNRKQAKVEAMRELEAEYGPIKADWKRHQMVQSVLPVIQAQIEDARKWKLFTESEDDIVKTLAANPAWSLERAYQHVVLPKFEAEQTKLKTSAQVTKDAMRAEILKEIKAAPKATSVPAGSAKTEPVSTTGRTLEDVINDAIKVLK